jgi:hypothetical protein
MNVHERVRAESDRFRSALPTLMESPLKGRWVVFLNGMVQSAFDDEDEALADATARFGHDGGFVIGRVAPQRLIWNTAPHLFK